MVNIYKMKKLLQKIINLFGYKLLKVKSTDATNINDITKTLVQKSNPTIFEIQKIKKIKGTDQLDLCYFPRVRSRKQTQRKLQIKLICTKSFPQFHYLILAFATKAVRILIDSTLKYPNYIGGTKSFDTKVIDASQSKIFCKHGAEGVFLFAHLTKGISGVVKVTDGNERAIPITIINIFKKLKIMNKSELKNLQRKEEFYLKNHAEKKIGYINCKII